MSIVNITGIDKVVLLKALWDNQKPDVFFSLNDMPNPEWDTEAATIAVSKYIDSFRGRLIRTDISGDEAESSSYDRETFTGNFQSVVDSLN